MDFALTDEQLEYKERCRTFAREVIRPAARKHDEEESIPWDVIKEARKQGFGGLEGIQRSAGDSEGQMQVISAEEFHWGCAGIALAISGSGLAAAGIASSGTPEQIMRWVPECFGNDEEIKLGAYAVTEPQAGSDVKSLKTTAKRDGDEWVLNGTKVFITNGGIADVHVVVAEALRHPAHDLLRRARGGDAGGGEPGAGDRQGDAGAAPVELLRRDHLHLPLGVRGGALDPLEAAEALLAGLLDDLPGDALLFVVLARGGPDHLGGEFAALGPVLKLFVVE